MTIKTLWTIILKTLGLWLGFGFLEAFIVFVQALLWSSGQGFNYLLGYSLIQVGLYGVVAFVLLFRTQFLIEKFKFEKDCQEEKLDLNQNLKSVLRVIIVSIGILTFINAFPSFLDQIVNHFQVNVKQGQSVSFWSYFKPIFLIKSFFGILLIVLNHSIASLISKFSSQ